jgi:signal peptidase I
MAARDHAPDPRIPSGPGLFRFGVESALLLAIAVTIFRAFFAEGYMISTGSMAPSLLGYHRRVACPSCRFVFERGAAFDPSVTDSRQAAAQDLDGHAGEVAQCPFCGARVSVDGLPRTEGDQLLVHKHHYVLRDPRRWEVVVFHNPRQPTQAYVKRVVGLPGELVQIVDGDVYADGFLQRKPLDTQMSVRLPVDDHGHQPVAGHGDWRPRWAPQWSRSGWREEGTTFVRQGVVERHTSESDQSPADAPIDWVAYTHRLRSDAPVDRRASIIDLCSYNSPSTGAEFPIHELMLELELKPLQSRDRQGAPSSHRCFIVAIHDGCHELRCTFDFDAGEVRLTADDKPTVHRSCPLPASLLAGGGAVLTMSAFDRQVLVAVDRELLFEPLLYAQKGPRPPLPEHPVRFGGRSGEFEVSNLRLYRDVYYTPDRSDDSDAVAMGQDQFYVLGDNSPVSLDSRAWEDPAVHRSMLIGRPFLVHLPSQQKQVPWGEGDRFVRVPDFSRVRYIR